MDKTLILIASLIAGFSFVIGALISRYLKREKDIIKFSLGLAFVVTIGLVVFDLLPEAINLFSNKNVIGKVFFVIGFSIIGILISKLFDYLIPHHSHSHDTIHVDHQRYLHLGIVSTIPLLLHNFIEGISIYSAGVIFVSASFILAFSVMLHNIPLGIQIGTSLREGQASNKKKMLIFSALSLSTPFGALLMFLFNNQISDQVVGILISITIGMLLYLIIFEFLVEIVKSADKRMIMYGAICGLIFTIVSLFM